MRDLFAFAEHADAPSLVLMTLQRVTWVNYTNNQESNKDSTLIYFMCM